MTADDVERIVRSVLKQYGLPFSVRHVAVNATEWTAVLITKGSTTTLTGLLSSPYAVRAALLKALSIDA